MAVKDQEPTILAKSLGEPVEKPAIYDMHVEKLVEKTESEG